MKKLMIIMMVLFALPFVTAIDFANVYTQSESGDYSYMGSQVSLSFINNQQNNGFMLRSTNETTGLDIADGLFGLCDSVLGGSNFNPVPINLYDSYTGYEHHSVIRPHTNYIEQISADCSIIDRYNLSGMTIVSQMGHIRAWKEDTDSYTMPHFAVLARNDSNNDIYALFLTLSNQSKLVLINQVFVTTDTDMTTYTNNFGIVGGCYSSLNSGCSASERVFGVVKSKFTSGYDQKLYTFDYFNGKYIKRVDGYVIYTIPSYYYWGQLTKQLLFFEDMDNNGYNEFVFLYTRGGNEPSTPTYVTLVMERIQPLNSFPYYDDFGQKTATIKGYTYYDNQMTSASIQGINICQLGSKGSPLEVCGFSTYLNGASNRYTLYFALEYDFSTYALIYTGKDYVSNMITPPFTLPFREDPYEDIVCMHNTSSSTDNYVCYRYDDEADTMDEFLFLDFQGNQPSDGFKEVFVSELNGDDTSLELVFSDGKVYSMNMTGSIKDAEGDTIKLDYLDDISPDLSNVYGQLFLTDLNGDDIQELIYASDLKFRIFSMNNTPWTLQNLTNITIPPEQEEDPEPEQGETIDGVPDIMNKLFDNINWIFGIIIIIVVIAAMVSMGISNPLLLLFGAILGTLIAIFLGLLTTGVVVIILLSIVIIIMLSLTVFKQN